MLRPMVMLLMLVPPGMLGGCCCPPRCSPPAGAGMAVAADDEGAAPAATEPKPPTAEAWEPIREFSPVNNTRTVLAKKRVRGLVWKDATLDEAMAYLQAITGIPFSLSERARAEKLDDVRLNAELDDVTVQLIVDVVMTTPWELTYRVEDGAVRILLESEVDPSMRLRYFDLKDLIRDPEASEIDELKAAEFEVRLRKSVSPEIWRREGVTMERRDAILIVRAPREALREIEQALDRMRRIERATR